VHFFLSNPLYFHQPAEFLLPTHTCPAWKKNEEKIHNNYLVRVKKMEKQGKN
jgi:hypothetical protein